ncbi:MAG: hypothetical protein Q4G46_11700 [Propionibacteriaceae bacterium]|nr:hypothetical protein [Propionibacteriaceae bacterium]
MLIMLALIPGVMSWFGGTKSSRTFAELQPGDCIALSVLDRGSAGTPLASAELVHAKVACDDVDLSTLPAPITYQIAMISPGAQTCPNAFYLDYFTTGVQNPEDRPRTYSACLVPNFSVAWCLADNPETHGYDVVACGPEALFRVVQVHEVDEPERCTGRTRPMEFPTPARTYCLEEAS